MASSKGLGLKARELTELLPPELGRFLFVKTEYKRAVEFDPFGTMAIPVLFDEYQKAADAFFNKNNEDLARSFELSQINKEIQKPPKIRFSVLAQWVQMPNMESEIKKEKLEIWAKYAKNWIEKYAPESEKFSIQKDLPKEIKGLSDLQKKILLKISNELENKWNGEDFQTKIYDLGKEVGLNGKETFAAVYLSLIGKDHGPKAAWLILSLDKEFVKKRFTDAAL